MQLTTACQATQAHPQLSESATDTAAQSKLSRLADLKPPHLALAGQRVEPLAGITAGDREIIGTNRQSLCHILSFGVREGLGDTSVLFRLLNAPYIQQPDLAREALESTCQSLSEALEGPEGVFQLSTQESPYTAGPLGLYIRPVDLFTIIECTAPDPLLDDWFRRFSESMGTALGFLTMQDMLAYEWDMQTDWLMIEADTFIENQSRIRELLDAQSLMDIIKLLDMPEDWFETMMGEDETHAAFSRLLYMASVLPADDGTRQSAEPLQALKGELECIVSLHPRLAYEPTIKKLLTGLPEIIEAAECLGQDFSEALEATGDRSFGEHFLISGEKISDDFLELVEAHGNHLYEVGDLGSLSLIPEQAGALKKAQAYMLLASKFFDVCDYR